MKKLSSFAMVFSGRVLFIVCAYSRNFVLKSLKKKILEKKILMVITDVNNLSVFLEIPCDCCSFLCYKMEDKSWRQHS